MRVERLLRFAYARRGAVLAATGLLLVLSAALLARLSFDADVLKLLPRNGPAVAGFEAYLHHFGTLDHVYLLFETPTGRISDHEAFVDRYVEELRTLPEIASVDAALFDEVKDWGYLFDRELFLLGPEQAAEGLRRLSPDAMAEELAASRGLLSMASPDVKAYVQQDPLGLLRLLRDRLGRGRSLIKYDPTQKGYVSADGRARLVVAQPVRPPFDTDFCKRLFAALARVEARSRAEAAALGTEEEPGAVVPGRGVRVQVAGGYRIALEAERQIRSESIVNSATSLAGLLLLVFAVFRTPWILLFGTVPLVIAAAFTLGVNGAAGPLSPATSGSAAMLFGLGIDGVVLMYLRYVEERSAGVSGIDAMGRTSGTAASVMLAYGTSAATFLALTLVDFPSLEQLGRIVGIGMLACCALLLTLLPALIAFTSSGMRRQPVTVDWLGRFVERHGRRILVVAAVATLALGMAATQLRLDMRLERLQAQTEGVAVEEQVADRFSLPRDVLLAVGQGPRLDPLLASAHALSAALERDMPSLAYASPDTLLPPADRQERVASAIRASGLDPVRLGATLEREAARAGFRPGSFDAFVARLPRLLDANQRLTYEGLAEHGLTPLLARFVARTASGYLVAVYAYPRTPAEQSQVEALAASAAPGFRLTGVPVVNRELANRFLPQFLRGISAGTLAVAVLIYLVFRRLRLTLLAFLPTLVGFVWSAGLLALLRIDLDLFSLFAAMTFVGIATDYGIYVIYRYSLERAPSMREVLTRTGAGILIACATTLIGFGSLVNSSYGPLHSFGITSVTTIASCLVASLLVLPALLQEARHR